ncbi:PAS domain-containing sensor histidine kinase [Methanococcoides sp. AM1]|uniref:PAS domain-containing sensor histidine kinase n=1 Tax=Methanococcoides sp. AM1 TaxID=1201011 RepID=UPI001083AAFD|nr:PAS domain-containing sensor histidine kinase [Methanococcoides sp. AM1]
MWDENVAIISPDGLIIYTNQSWKQFAKDNGLDPGKYSEGTNYLKVCDELNGNYSTDASAATKGITDVINGTNDIFKSEYQYQGPDEVYWFLMKVTPLSRSYPTHVLLQHIDINDRKRAEEELRERDSELQSIFRAAPTGIGVVQNRVLKHVNDLVCEITGYSRAELVGQSARILYPSDDEYEYVGKEKYAQIEKCGVGTVETQWQRKDGKVIDILLSSSPINPDDLSQGVTFTALDITNRKKAEIKLYESEKKYSTLVENGNDGIIILQGDVIKYANKTMQEMSGYSYEEITGKSFIKFVSPEYVDLIKEKYKRRLNGERIRKYIDMSYSSILHLETGFYEDSSKNIEALSKISEKPFRTILVDTDLIKMRLENIVLEHDCVSKARRIKEATEKVASCSMSIEVIKELVELKNEKEVAEKITQMYYILFAPEKVSYISLKDGLVQSEFSTSSDPDNELNRDFLDIDKKYLINENRDSFLLKIKSNIGVMGTVEVKGLSYPGNISDYLNTAIIISNASSLVVSNIRRYQEILESKKRQQDLTDTLKVMNKILRHDVANNLNVEINAIELYNIKKDAKFLEMAHNSAYRSVETIKNMKDMEYQFFRDDQELLPYHIHDLIESAFRHFDIESSIEGNALIMADNALPSVIENLIRNAQVHGKADSIQVIIEDDQTNCKICFKDNGVGIPDEVKSYIFDEGFKYGDTGNTGLGLYIVKKTIERYHGGISVKDNAPKGVSFVIELPSIHTVDTSIV